MAVIALLAFLAFAIIDWVAVSNGHREAEWVAKPAALAALIVYAASADDPSRWLIAALALSLLGDIYLMLPAELFLAGMSAFFLAHVGYVVAFDAGFWWRGFWWILALAAAAPVATRIARAIDDPGLRGAVVAYMAVITLMLGSAIAAGAFVGMLGALLFMLSDSVIAWNKFVAPLSWAQPTIIVTYHLGQLGLVLALR